MMDFHLHFHIPDPQQFPSGGNIYNANLMAALQVHNQKISTGEAVWEKSDVARIILVDTLFLNDFNPAEKRFPCIVIVHHLLSMELEEGPKKERQQGVEQKQLAAYSGFLATSNFTAVYLKEKLQLSQAILEIPPAIDFQVPSKTDDPASSDSLKTIMVANLIHRKGILPFLKEWAKYSWPAAFSLSIIGSRDLEPDYARACHDFCQKLSSAQQRQIIFTGTLSRSEIAKKYSEASLFIAASRMETYGMAIQEALAFGLPVLAVEGGYTATHIRSGENGFCFKTEIELVQKMAQLSSDLKALQALQNGARTLAGSLARSWSTAASDFLYQLKTHFGNG